MFFAALRGAVAPSSCVILLPKLRVSRRDEPADPVRFLRVWSRCWGSAAALKGHRVGIAPDLGWIVPPDPGITKGGSDAFLRSSELGGSAVNNPQSPSWELNSFTWILTRLPHLQILELNCLKLSGVYDLCWGKGRSVIMHHLTERSSITQHQSKLQWLSGMEISLSNKKRLCT